jgi:hypothetical protein
MSKHAILIFCWITAFAFVSCAMEKQANGKQNEIHSTQEKSKFPGTMSEDQLKKHKDECSRLLQISKTNLEKFFQVDELTLCQNNLSRFKEILTRSSQSSLPNWKSECISIWNSNEKKLRTLALTALSSVQNFHAGFYQELGRQYCQSNPNTTLDKFQIATGLIDITPETKEITLQRELKPVDKSAEVLKLVMAAHNVEKLLKEIDILTIER